MLLICFADIDAPCQSLPPVRDDSALSDKLVRIRDKFLAMRRQNQPGFDRLDCVLMLREPDRSWRRGSVNGTSISYPASCVKLPYLLAAVHWCREQRKLPQGLDIDVSPMIRVSDNVATGRVIDTITSAPNLSAITSTADPRYKPWLYRRQYPSRLLQEYGLLENQMVVHKTYPSNSGTAPTGAESVAVSELGGNRMQSQAAAMLLAGIIDGKLEPQATDYMRDLLTHPRWSGDSAIGFGLPPGSLYQNKVGLAFDTLEDIAYVALPNKKEFILAVFTDAYCGSETTQPYPYDSSLLGVFCELLMKELNVTDGCPSVVVVDNASQNFRAGKNWQHGSAQAEAYGHDYLYAQGSASGVEAAWSLDVPEAGIYEVSAWYPQSSNRAEDAAYKIMHADGTATIRLNQQQTGGRWVRLGDFRFQKGKGSVRLGTHRDSSKVVVADAIKAAKWPATPRGWKPVTGETSATLSKNVTFY